MSGSQSPLLENATRDLAQFAAALRYEDIPRQAVECIKLSMLDSIGCCLFGATLPWTLKVAVLAVGEGAQPVASLMGMGRKSSVSLAVLVNSTAGHAFELDDIHKESIVHPGSLAMPVAMAYAESAGGASGRDVITAMIAGYEVGTRVGSAATMSLFLRGFHP
ncbi:MAG: MmgE/PrpD family protein, partial [Sulfuricaulis sp.]|nr:MmgE/PrpD family protein [Sulfuricaulis sp.]